jgi:hypothetical protein
MNIQNLKSIFKEKTAKIVSNLKILFINAKSKIVSDLKILFINAKSKVMAWPRKKKLIALALAALVVAVGVKVVVWPFSKNDAVSQINAQAKEEYNILFKGKPTITAKMGDTVNLGNLKIDFYNIKESSYLSFDKDQNQNRITVRYLAAQISVQNLSGEKSESILIGLTDDKGKNYRVDYAVPFYVFDTRDFGRNMVMFSRTITDGYIFFSNMDENAKNLELIIALTSSKEKVAFKFERKAK